MKMEEHPKKRQETRETYKMKESKYVARIAATEGKNARRMKKKCRIIRKARIIKKMKQKDVGKKHK
jgi:hypothetical protein